MIEINGVITALLTPLKNSDKLDVEGLRELIEFQIKSGVNGFFVSGTTGESILLGIDLRKKLIEKVRELTSEKVTIIFQVGSANIRDVRELVNHAYEIGVNLIASFPPLYYPYDRESLINYYVKFARMRNLSIFIYNIPPRTGINIDYEIINEMRKETSNIIGIKDSSGDLKNTLKYLKIKDFNVLMGSDTLSLPGLVAGCNGLVSALSNVFPELFVKMYESFRKGNLDKAQELYSKITYLRTLLGKYPYIASYKVALNLRGLAISNIVSEPLRPLNDNEIKKMKQELDEFIES